MADRYTQIQRQLPTRYHQDHEYAPDGESAHPGNTYMQSHQLRDGHDSGGGEKRSSYSRTGSDGSMALYQIPQQAYAADRRPVAQESSPYSNSMPFAQQTPNLPNDHAFSMGHMINSLHGVPSLHSPFPTGVVANPGQQTTPHASRQSAGNPYFQQHSQLPHGQRHVPYQAQSGPPQYQNGVMSIGFPPQHFQQPHQPYPMQGFGSYSIYPNQHSPFYQPPPPMVSPGVNAGPQPIRAGMGKVDGHIAEHPLGRADGYPSERIQYPFHAAQIQQHLGFSSSGSNATCGSVPERLLQAAVPRGPPRKPKQSGHALWVGNLPPGATVADLKDHFSRGLSSDIESLKLISKSNCAFVNYKTQAACAVAMQKFHDSRFHGTRLVCRLRRASGPTPSVVKDKAFEEPLVDGEVDQQQQGDHLSTRRSHERVPERFFVLKSLTLHDLEVSVRTGYWATQSHNEDILNEAYNTADNVYLIFSANKSGEYFGYARMTSSITSEPMPEDPRLSPQATHASDHSPSSEHIPVPASTKSGSGTFGSLEAGPRSIPTPATEWAPKGRIIDDLARGTIFWEADQDDDASDNPELLVDGTEAATAPPLVDGEVDGLDHTASHDSFSHSQALHKSNTATTATGDSDGAVEYLGSSGGSFQVEWLSTRRVPFYTTRGLRNPWNVNREVKIARDGTELEPSVGKKLVALFGNPAIGGQQQLRRVPVPPMGIQGVPQGMGIGVPMMGYN